MNEKQEISKKLEEIRSAHLAFKTRVAEIIAEMRERGYTLSSHSGDNMWLGFSNIESTLSSGTPVLHATLTTTDKKEWRCELTHVIRLCHISTGKFCYPHPRFEKTFEKQLLDAAYACSHLLG